MTAPVCLLLFLAVLGVSTVARALPVGNVVQRIVDDDATRYHVAEYIGPSVARRGLFVYHTTGPLPAGAVHGGTWASWIADTYWEGRVSSGGLDADSFRNGSAALGMAVAASTVANHSAGFVLLDNGVGVHGNHWVVPVDTAVGVSHAVVVPDNDAASLFSSVRRTACGWVPPATAPPPARARGAVEAAIGETITVRVLDVLVVNDLLRYEELGNETEADAARVFALASLKFNATDSDTGVRIRLAGQLTITDAASQFASSDVDADPLAYIEQVRVWLADGGAPGYDVVAVLTGVMFSDSVMGVAYTAAACDPSTAVSVTTANGGIVWVEAAVLAHEIGHNLGACHTPSSPRGDFCPELSASEIASCAAEEDTSLMSATLPGTVLGAASLEFDKCSRSDIDVFLSSVFSTCLESENVSLPADECGNGVLDDGEDCDPWLGASVDACCNPDTCKLVSGAVCTPAIYTCCTTECAVQTDTTLECHSRGCTCDGVGPACPETCVAGGLVSAGVLSAWQWAVIGVAAVVFVSLAVVFFSGAM